MTLSWLLLYLKKVFIIFVVYISQQSNSKMTKKIIVSLSIILGFIFFLIPSKIYAADCLDVCPNQNLTNSGNWCQDLDVASTVADGKVNIKVADTNGIVEGKFNQLGITEKKLCVIRTNDRLKGVSDNGPANCQVVTINDGQGVTFPTLPDGNHSFGIFTNGDIDGDNGVLSLCSINQGGGSFIDVNVDQSSAPAFTPTPTPRSDCLNEVGASCIVTGLEADARAADGADTSRGVSLNGLSVCNEFLCSPVSDLPVPQGRVIAFSGQNYDNDDIRKAIEQATRDCGRPGLQCCTPRVLPPSNISHGLISTVLDTMLKWVKNLGDAESMIKSIEKDLNSVITGGVCKQTGTVPELTYKNGTKAKVDNFYSSANEPTGEEAYYRTLPFEISQINSYDQCKKAGGDEDECRRQSLTPTIIPITPIRIPESEVDSCNCVSADGETNPYQPDAAEPRNMSEDDIKEQIKKLCGNNTCLDDCINDGGFWQGWRNSGKGECVKDENTAKQNLQDFIDKNKTQSQATQTTASIGTPSVLNASTEVEAYIKSCETITKTWARRWCKVCRIGGGFWGVWGCADQYVNTDQFDNLCKNFDDPSEKGACLNCTSSGRMWTAIGCVEFSLQGIIQEQVFGWGIGLAGISAILCIIYSAFILQTSGNNPEKIKQAQDTMTACITGLVVIILSVFILNVIGVDILRIPGFQRSM